MLLTSHELGQLEAMADDVVFLLEGRVRFEGELVELLAATGYDDLEGAIASLILEGRTLITPGALAAGDGGPAGPGAEGVA